MLIISNTETIICSMLFDYKNALERCMKTINEIWCSKEDNSYPCLAILVNNKEKKQAAVINYFEQENGNMYVSVGDTQKEDIVKFGEYKQYQVAAYQIISIEEALECAIQFFYRQELPCCIQWEEL